MFVHSGKSIFSKPRGAKGLALLLCMVFMLTVVNFTTVIAVDPVVDGKFTIAIIPDTQNEVTYSTAVSGQWFSNRVQYLVNNKTALDLRYVVHTGDMVNWPRFDPSQLAIAAPAMQLLGNANIPYLPALGNHDTGATYIGGSAVPGEDASVNVRNTTHYNAAFPLSRFPGIVTFEANKVDNSYRTFEAEGKKWLVLSLELWPRTAAIDWAKGVVQNHPDYNVIILTHSYLTSSGAIDQSNGGYGANSAQYLYDNLVKVYPNIRFVFSGHVGDAAKREDTGVNGNKIVSILGCFHSNTNNPVDLLEINASTGTATTKFYAPLDGYEWTQYRWTFTGMNFVSPESTPTTLMEDSFNTGTTGAAPAGWILNTSGGTVTVQEVPSASEKSIRLQKTSANSGYAAAMKKFTAQTSGIVTYDTWVMVPETSSRKYIFARTYDESKIATCVAFSDGYIKVNDSINVQTFVANQWYHIVADMNMATKTFTLSVDEVNKGTYNFQDNTVADLGEMLFSVAPNYTGTLYVSFIKVTK